MKIITLTSTDALDAAVADIVRLKIQHTVAVAKKDAAVAQLEKLHTSRIVELQEEIAALESQVQEYCNAHRSALFPEKKSRETPLANYGFEFTPPRVETSSRKIKWKDVIDRLSRLGWGKAYIRKPDPQIDKQALLTDRDKITPEQRTAAGIQFCQDEQFFIRPKPETAQDTARAAA